MLCVSDNCHQCNRSNNESKKINKKGEMHYCSLSASCPQAVPKLSPSGGADLAPGHSKGKPPPAQNDVRV